MSTETFSVSTEQFPTEPPKEQEYGPDASNTVPDPEPKNSKNNGKKRQTPFSKLGANKQARGGPRKLTDKDKQKLSSLYVTAGMFLMPVKPVAAQAFAEHADECADAWFELASENDSVRRTVLMLIEGGAWGKVLAAHLPLLLALLPEGSLPFSLPNNTTDAHDAVTSLFGENTEQ